jgi:hypothetical protein
MNFNIFYDNNLLYDIHLSESFDNVKRKWYILPSLDNKVTNSKILLQIYPYRLDGLAIYHNSCIMNYDNVYKKTAQIRSCWFVSALPSLVISLHTPKHGKRRAFNRS